MAGLESLFEEVHQARDDTMSGELIGIPGVGIALPE